MKTHNTQQIEFKPEFLPVNSNPSQTLISREFESSVIRQRNDGYVDATAMCKATGKRIDNYWRLDSTQAFLNALSENTGMPIKSDTFPFPQKSVTEQNQALIEIIQGGNPEQQGTWVHPRVAIHLAQWCSPEFAVQVTDWVFELMTKGEVSIKPQIAKSEIENYIDECLERKQAGEEIPPLDSCGLIRKAISEGFHTRREIAEYTGIKYFSVVKIIQRMLKAGEVHCTMVKTQSKVFLN